MLNPSGGFLKKIFNPAGKAMASGGKAVGRMGDTPKSPAARPRPMQASKLAPKTAPNAVSGAARAFGHRMRGR